MNSGQQLQDWLSDRGRQKQTQAAIDGFARSWNRGPVQQAFEAAMARLPAQSAEAVAAAARDLFADDRWVDALIDGLAGQLRTDPFFDPPFRALGSDIHGGLILFEDERVSIAAGVTRVLDLAAKKTSPRDGTSIGFSGRVSVLKFVKAGEARISLWDAPPTPADFAASDGGRCVRAGERQLADGDILTIDGRRQGYVIEQARSNLLVLQAEITLDQGPLSVEYD